MAEIWKPIEGHEDYVVSNFGNIKNIKTGNLLVPRKTKAGYLRVHILTASRKRDMYIHRIVADAFCSKSENCDVVNHIDNNPQNNRADNLEWTTQRNNVIYAMKQGRVKKFPNAKKIIGIKDEKEYVFQSSHEAAVYAKCDHKTVLRGCLTGRQTNSGFIWKAV